MRSQGQPEDRLLDAAEQLFYARGIQAVGMDEIRAASGVPLKRIYQLFPGKEELVLAFLRRRDERWLASLTRYVDAVKAPQERAPAVFDWLGEWFAEPTFNGCAWINAHGELGATSPAVAQAVRAHKQAFRALIGRLVSDAATADALFLLAEGAMVTAGIQQRPSVAVEARHAAEALLARRSG